MSPSLPSIATDVALLEALQSGDERAFEEVFRRYYATVYAVLLRITGSPEEAEDLAQEVFLRLYQQPIGARPETNLAGWLYRVATNLGFNALRSRQRTRLRLLRWARLEGPLYGDRDSPAEAAERSADAEAVRRALAGLSTRDRTALILRHSGVSYAEIAAALGVKTGSVGTILVRAERALRDRYRAANPNAGKE